METNKLIKLVAQATKAGKWNNYSAAAEFTADDQFCAYSWLKGGYTQGVKFTISGSWCPKMPVTYYAHGWQDFAILGEMSRLENRPDLSIDTPDFQLVNERFAVTLPAADLAWVASATTKDNMRQYFNGVRIDQNGVAVGTDGYSMHLMGDSNQADNSTATIIPTVVIELMVKAAKIVGDKFIRFTVSDTYAKASVDGFSITFQPIDSTYPDFKRVVPKDDTLGEKIAIDPKKMVAEINHAAKLSKALNISKSRKGAYAAVNGSITIHPQLIQSGDYQIIDCNYLKAAIDSHKSAIFHKATNPLRQSVILINDHLKAVIMPIRGE